MARGWLLALAMFLFAWEPFRVATEFTSASGTIGARGAGAIVELCAHAVVAAICVAAGWALWMGSPHAPELATAGLVLSACTSVQSMYWSALPHQTMPGEQLPASVLALAHAAGWIAYLRYSRRVRQAYG